MFGKVDAGFPKRTCANQEIYSASRSLSGCALVERVEQDRQRQRSERHLAVADAQRRQRQKAGLAVVALPALGERVEALGHQATDRLAAPAHARRLATDDLVEPRRRGVDQPDRAVRRIDGETALCLEPLLALDEGQENEIDEAVLGAPAFQLLGAAA